MKKFLLPGIVGLLFLFPFLVHANSNLSNRLSGRILLQVEEKGEAWYIEPTTKERAFLGRPDDAFRIMRELGLGVSEKDFKSFGEYAPKRLSGRIVLRVEANGEAYYVNPVDLKMHFLGRPTDAFGVMRNLGLGVTNQDIEKVPVLKKYAGVNNSSENIEPNNVNTKEDSNLKSSDTKINTKIQSLDNSISELEKTVTSGEDAVERVRVEMAIYPEYYLVQSSGQQLINEVETSIFLINKSLGLVAKIKNELSRLYGTGNETSEYIRDLEGQLDNNSVQISLSSDKIARLNEVFNEDLENASLDALNKATNELEKAEKVLEAANTLNFYLDEIDNKLNDLGIELDAKKSEIEYIKKQPKSAYAIYNELNIAYDEYDAIVIEYNNLLDLRDETVRLFEVLDDYFKKNIPISNQDLKMFSLFGISL